MFKALSRILILSSHFILRFDLLLTTTSGLYAFLPVFIALLILFIDFQRGNDFLRPLIILNKSKLEGLQNANKILQLLEKGENVVILSNHQTEADPQVLSVLLESVRLAQLAEQIVFIAGHKVTNDPIAVPFSMVPSFQFHYTLSCDVIPVLWSAQGRNLLCIHSKKHIKNPPEDMARKSAQNLESMKVRPEYSNFLLFFAYFPIITQAMGELLATGGKVFWVAPSGGRDRPGRRMIIITINNRNYYLFFCCFSIEKILKPTSSKWPRSMPRLWTCSSWSPCSRRR